MAPINEYQMSAFDELAEVFQHRLWVLRTSPGLARDVVKLNDEIVTLTEQFFIDAARLIEARTTSVESQRDEAVQTAIDLARAVIGSIVDVGLRLKARTVLEKLTGPGRPGARQ